MTLLLPSNPAHTNHTIYTGGRKAECIREPEDDLLDDTKDNLLFHAKQNDIEVCGFITDIEDIYIVENCHEEPTHNFYMGRESFNKVVDIIYGNEQSKILGLFHTHPNNQPWPSPRDLVGWPNPDLGWRYWIVTKKEVLEWELSKR